MTTKFINKISLLFGLAFASPVLASDYDVSGLELSCTAEARAYVVDFQVNLVETGRAPKASIYLENGNKFYGTFLKKLHDDNTRLAGFWSYSVHTKNSLGDIFALYITHDGGQAWGHGNYQGTTFFVECFND